MPIESQVGIEQIVDKIITQVAAFEKRHPSTPVDTDITGIVLSYMLKDSIHDLNQELAKHNLQILEHFALNKANNTWRVVSTNS